MIKHDHLALVAALVGVLAYAPQRIAAADQTWKTTGPSDSWNLTDLNWNAGVAWTNGNNALFTGTGEAITVNSVTANGLSFSGNGYSLTSGTLTLGGPVSINTGTGISASIGSTIASAVGLTKTGSGTLTLTARSSYTGGTTVSNGTLVINAANAGNSAIGTGTLNIGPGAQVSAYVNSFGWNYETPIVINGGTLRQMQFDSHLNSVTMTGGTLSGEAGTAYELHGTVTVNASAATSTISVPSLNVWGGTVFDVADGAAATDLLVSSGQVIGGGFLTKTGAGTMVLTGQSTYAGGTTVSAGTLQVGNGSAGASLPSGGSVVNNSALVFNHSDSLAVSNVISGTGSITKLGTGTLTLTAQNTFTGGTTVNQGVLYANAVNSAYGAMGYGNVTVNNGGTILVGGDNSFVGGATSGTKTITINAGGTITNTANTCHLNALVMNGGTLAAATANAAFGNWNLDCGVSTPGNGRSSSIAGGNAALTQTGGTVFNIGAGDTLTVSAALDHVGDYPYTPDTGLIKTGSGTLVLSGANTYKGDTTIKAGTLRLNVAGSTATAFRVASGAAIDLNYSGTYVVGNFYTNGVPLPNGIYNAGNLAGFITGSGSVQVVAAIPRSTTVINPQTTWGAWEGWGVSLCWWANVFGYRDDLADLLFTTNYTTYYGNSMPGLGMNIARYNAGGCNTNMAPDGSSIQFSPNIPDFKKVTGYWLGWNSSDPASSSWDWTVDANQRAMLLKAKARSANKLQLFSNSPMWWMCYNHNPSGADGGGENLQSWNYNQHAVYLATIAKYAQTNWGVTFDSVEAFNEPASWYWYATGTQEGCYVAPGNQASVIGYLRSELNNRGLTNMTVVASDETSYDIALSTWNSFSSTTKSNVGLVAVHGYQYGNGPRSSLYSATAGKRLWNSEYGESDASGLSLASNLNLDLHGLHPTAWCYWQPFDSGGWGLIQSNPGDNWLGPANPKYYVLAQYTRHIRPGMIILDNGDTNTVTAYDPVGRKLVIVTVNYGTVQNITYNLSGFYKVTGPINCWITATGNGVNYVPSGSPTLNNKQFSADLSTNTIQTFEIQSVDLDPPPILNVTPIPGTGQITLNWPAAYQSWILQRQTNALNTGLGTNWVDLGVILGATTNVPLNAGPAVFYRLRHP